MLGSLVATRDADIVAKIATLEKKAISTEPHNQQGEVGVSIVTTPFTVVFARAIRSPEHRYGR